MYLASAFSLTSCYLTGAKDNYENAIRDLLLNNYTYEKGATDLPLAAAVVEEIIGSAQHRYGPRPNEKSVQAMRVLAEKYLRRGEPLPFLVPCGPKKPVCGRSIDLAEFSALKMLACLNTRVGRLYPPGLTINLRLEDATGWILEQDIPGAKESMATYLSDLETLIRVLGYDFIHPIRESSLVAGESLRTRAFAILPTILAYLQESDEQGLENYQTLSSWRSLQALGWQGEIPTVQREHYHERFGTHYPHLTHGDRLFFMARYFAVTLARYQLSATGADKNWQGHFQYTFAPPVPGTPDNMVSTRVYCRTAPLKQTKRHLPFWRSRGYLRLNGSASIGLASFREEIPLQPCSLQMSSSRGGIVLQTEFAQAA